MWCGGARETREPRVTIGRLFHVTDTLSDLPAFQDFSCIFKNLNHRKAYVFAAVVEYACANFLSRQHKGIIQV